MFVSRFHTNMHTLRNRLVLSPGAQCREGGRNKGDAYGPLGPLDHSGIIKPSVNVPVLAGARVTLGLFAGDSWRLFGNDPSHTYTYLSGPQNSVLITLLRTIYNATLMSDRR